MLRHIPCTVLFLALACAPHVARPADAGDPFEVPAADGQVKEVPDPFDAPEETPVEAPRVESDPDPWEGFNRRIFNFNEGFDRRVFKPVARGYRKATPDWLDDAITRFFENLRDLRSGLNNVLQWEWANAGSNFGRFGVNTTLGVGGLFDVASDMNLRKVRDDLSATLAKWGVPQGPYLVLPFLGPSTVRDAATIWPEDYMTPRAYIEHDLTRWSITAVYAVDLRADLLDLERAIVGDRYTFIRDVWLQNRRMIIGEPLPEDDFGAGFDEFDDEEW